MPKTASVLAEGKTKILRESTTNANEIIVEFKDDATAFNAIKHKVFEGKGALNATISKRLFELLASHNIPTCYLRAGDTDNILVYSKLTMIPLEIVVRNVAFGSIVKRLKFTEGSAFGKPLLELFLKTDDDPLVNDEVVEALGLMPEGICLKKVKSLAYQVNELFVAYFDTCGIVCADMKIEMGINADGELVIGDELSPDNFRLRDKETGRVLDKDVFRKDLGDLMDAYRTLNDRLQATELTNAITTMHTYRAEVFVQSRKNILNPEAEAIRKGLRNLGFENINELEAGKRFVLKLSAPTMIDAERQIKGMTESLLANTVIEDFSYNLTLN